MTEQSNAGRGMNEEERHYADLIYAAIQSYSSDSERSQQSKGFRAGVSDLGFCSERLRRMIAKQVPEDTDWLKAFIGTALGDHIEKAVALADPTVLIQQEIEVALRGEQYVYTLTGHPDMVFVEDGLVLDGKTSFGLNLARRMGADLQKQFQRNLYGLGCFEGNLFKNTISLEDVKVGNVWLDRSGNEQCVHVEITPLSLEVIDEAARWLDEVQYAFVNDQEAPKEPAREICEKTCGFFRVCREFDTDISGLLTDPEVVAAAAMYDEGRDEEKSGKSKRDEAKSVLRGINGSTGEFMVRNTWVNATETRAGYMKIDVKPIK